MGQFSIVISQTLFKPRPARFRHDVEDAHEPFNELAADKFGRLYWVGTFGQQFGLLRVSGLFDGPASTVVDVVIPNLPLDFSESAPLFTVDQYSRVTVVSRELGTIQRWIADTTPFTPDPTFTPVLDDPTVAPHINLTNALDLDVDGLGTTYLTIDTTNGFGVVGNPPATGLFRLNEDGHVADFQSGIPTGGASPLPSFAKVLALASSPFGTLAVINQPGIGSNHTAYL